MVEGCPEYCEEVNVLARTPRVPRMPSFFRALRESPSPFDATVLSRARGWTRIDFLIRGRKGVTLEAVRSRAAGFRDVIRNLTVSARSGRPRRAREGVIRHLGETRVLYRLKVCSWVQADDDWYFVFMLGAYLCEFGRAILHNPAGGFVQPGRGQLLKP